MSFPIRFGIAITLLSASGVAWAQQVPVIPAECAATSNNCAVATQTGSNATATINQPGTSNTAVVEQTSVTGAVSTVEQSGSVNFAEVEQIDNGLSSVHRSTIDQGGDRNTAFLIQNERGSSAGQFSDIDQSGSDNYADVAQTGFADDSFVTQSSDGNSAIVIQDSVLNGVGFITNQTSTVIQSGTGGHIANVSQTQGILSNSYVEQQGDTNTATAIQIATRQDLDIIQTGNGNIATVSQGQILFGPGENIAFVEQIGNFNQSTITQVQSSSTNNARSTQSGDNGRSTIIQEGEPVMNARNNSATLNQLLGSSEAVSLIDQMGEDNIASVTQGGIGDMSTVIQNGNGNMATVSQNVP
ncbi:hypothetical protein [Erythrobacter dokdonensis]|uniref:Curlin associated repeat protein n=1 Tax=Erythrobacter dokdonensis DSW-74 TaxID=1300349 RepID=A0A1A7BKR1_9SPHN|nr:hypothetical protein [Erythrobacter dokdonensis]OBV12072.1 Curlin associated repeat protein [Erythrobacter dokdonensis DSW-74]